MKVKIEKTGMIITTETELEKERLIQTLEEDHDTKFEVHQKSESLECDFILKIQKKEE